jgi:hypothetical protein
VSAIVPVHSPEYMRVIISRFKKSSPKASMSSAAPVVSPANPHAERFAAIR